MSQIPYFPTFDNCKNNVKIVNDVFTINNIMVVAPFDMVDVTNQQIFSNHQVNEHYYCSRQPLFDNNYYFFEITSNNVIDVSQREEPYFFQQENILNKKSDVSFYFFKTPAPLYLTRVNSTFKTYPFTYPSLQMKTGHIDGVNIIDLADQNVMLDVDNLALFLNKDDLALINQVNLQQLAGLQGGR